MSLPNVNGEVSNAHGVNSYEGYTIVNAQNFVPPQYKLLGSKRKKVQVYDCESILDIETSHNHNLEELHTWVYQWCWLLNDTIVVGRDKEDIYLVQEKLQEINNKGIFRTFVHNLPYEFSYLQQGWEEHFGREGEIMASAPHKPFKCQYGNMEFLCSYKMSNRSLSAWGKYYSVEHKKIDNGIDYNAIHYPTDELSIEDWYYNFNDVICPRECIHALMKQENMRYDQLLMTSTMYVKNEVTKEYVKERSYFDEFSKKKYSVDTYKTLRKSFVGGITHANWKVLNTTVRGDIRHYDFNSHYPTQMITKLFPMGKVELLYNETDKDITTFLPNNDYAYWLVVDFENLRLRDHSITMPYISSSKCEGLRDAIKDNGRLVASTGYTRMYISSYDLKWILKQYIVDDYIIKHVYRSKLGKLPPYLRDTILSCYKTKCGLKVRLKALEKQGKETSDEYRDIEVDYNKSKNILNGLYGVCATDPIRDDVEFDGEVWTTVDVHDDTELIQERLDKFYSHRNHWTRYEWGCWVTSLARDELMICIELVGYENFLYCDTDSIFFMNNGNLLDKITTLNRQWLDDSKQNNYSVEYDGITYYMHSFEEEPKLQTFRTLGAKCYAMIQDEKLQCTIAGVPSRKSYIIDGKCVTYTRNEELGSIENLTVGFSFTKCVPTRAVYTDEGCVILNSEHKLSLCDSLADKYFTEHCDA